MNKKLYLSFFLLSMVLQQASLQALVNISNYSSYKVTIKSQQSNLPDIDLVANGGVKYGLIAQGYCTQNKITVFTNQTNPSFELKLDVNCASGANYSINILNNDPSIAAKIPLRAEYFQ